MKTLIVLLLSLHVVMSSTVFGDKTNTDLYCKLSDAALEELSVEPAKHLYSDVAGDTYVYNGASITVKCSNSSLTFTNAMVDLVGDTDEYKLYKSAVVQCYYSTIIIPHIFTGIDTYCAAGCPEPTFNSLANFEITPTQNTGDSDAPYAEGTYTVACSPGYVRAWADDGDNYFSCADGGFNASQSDMVACAPGCMDLSNEILPYRRSLAIIPATSTELNMVWPGAPYPWGAKLYFTCYGSSDYNKVSSDDPLYCYQEKKGEPSGTCDSDTCEKMYGYWNDEAPYCKWKYGGSFSE